MNATATPPRRAPGARRSPARPSRRPAPARIATAAARAVGLAAVLLAVWLGAAAAQAQTGGTAASSPHDRIERDTDVPPLPFADNPDPALCGIPQPVGPSEAAARVTGWYDGALVMDPVLVYDSHLRRSVVGSIPDGHAVELVLFQANPELDYFLVKAEVEEDGELRRVEGWLPAPFVARSGSAAAPDDGSD